MKTKNFKVKNALFITIRVMGMLHHYMICFYLLSNFMLNVFCSIITPLLRNGVMTAQLNLLIIYLILLLMDMNEVFFSAMFATFIPT